MYGYGFQFQESNCNSCHHLRMLRLNISDIAIITNKGVRYRCTIHYTSKSEAIHLLRYYELDDHGYI